MLILKIALQILAVAAALLTATLNYVARDKRTRQFKRLRVGLYWVTGLSLAAGIVVTVGDDLTRRRELAALTDELARIQTAVRRTSDAVTGGESFPYLNIVEGRVLLINEGRDPLYDIGVRMWDPSDYRNVMTSAEFWQLERRALNFTVSNMPPASAREVAQLQLPATRVKTFEATMIARNGSFSQQLVMRQVDGAWRTAYRIFRGPAKLPAGRLLERVDPLFPRDQRGEVRWDGNR